MAMGDSGTMNEKTKGIILNVNDDEVGRYATTRLLLRGGYEVWEAASGEQGLLIAADGPDLVLLDVKLPGIDGFEVCRRLKSDPATASIPVLHHSATYVDAHSHAYGLEHGADGYLTLPVEPVVLLATVRALLRTAQAEAALRQARDTLELRVAERTAALETEVRDRRRAEEEARSQAGRSQALAHTAARLNATLDLDTVLHAVAVQTSEALDVPLVTICLYDTEKQLFTPVYGSGLSPEAVSRLRPPANDCPADLSGDLGLPLVIPDLQAVPASANAAIYRELGLRAMASAFLTREGQLVGRLNIFTKGEKRDFDEGELTLLQALADQAGMAITNARLFEEVKEKREQLGELSRQLIHAEEEERRRLSRELHDSVGQMVTALKINLSLLRDDLDEKGELHRQFNMVVGMLTQLHDEVRQVSQSLRPATLEVTGLSLALSSLCYEFTQMTQLPIDYDGAEIPVLNDSANISLYRFVQEALTNAAKHAQASAAEVTLRRAGDFVQVTVVDNGVGFDMTMSRDNSGLGLLGMQERLKLLGGGLDVTSAPGQGTRLTAYCPIIPS